MVNPLGPSEQTSDRSASAMPPVDPLRRFKRRRRFWFLVKLLCALVILLLGVFVFLQSNMALQQIYLPMISERVGAKLTAASGSVHVNGQVEIKEAVLVGNDGEPAFVADQILLHVTPFSLLPGHTPVIDHATFTAPQFRVRIDDQGRTNWDFKPQGKAPAAHPSASPDRKAAAPRLAVTYPNIDIKDLEVNELAVDYQNGNGLKVLIQSLDLSVQQMARGETGTFGLTAEGTLERPAAHIQQHASISARGRLAQDAKGGQIGWDGTLSAAISGLPADQTGATSQTVQIQATHQGTADIGGKFTQQFELAASTPKGKVGQFKGHILWDGASQMRQAQFAVNNVNPDFLNPFIAALGPVQLTRSNINATCQLSGSGKLIAVQSQLSAQDLCFVAGDGAAPTPPLTLNFTQQGTYDPESRLAQLDAMNLALLVNGAPALDAKLDRPVSMDLRPAAPAAAAGQSARILMNVNNLTMQTLQPWLAMTSYQEARGIREGSLSGQMVLDIDRAGELLTLQGQLSGAGVRVEKWGDQPFNIHQDLRARLEELNKLSIDKSRFTVDSGGRRLADVAVSLHYLLDKQEGDGDVRTSCSQALLAAKSFGLLKNAELKNFQDGPLESTENVRFTAAGKVMTIDGTAALSGAALAISSGESIPINAQIFYHASRSDKHMVLDPMRIELKHPQGGESASIQAQGKWPVWAAEGGTGELKIAVRKLDLTPWINLTQSGPGKLASPLPFESDQTLTVREDGKILWSGEERLGPVQTVSASGEKQTLSLKVRGEFEKLGDAVEKLSFDLSSNPRLGSPDMAHIDGNGQLGDAPQFSLNAEVASLTLDPYLALIPSAREAAPIALKGAKPGKGAKPLPPKAASNVQTQSAPGPAGTAGTPPPSSPPPAKPARPARTPLIVQANLDIKRFSFQKASLSDAKGTLHFENGVFETQLEQGKLRSGTIKGNFQYDAGKREPRYAWDLSLGKVDMETLLSLAKPEWSDKVTGTADITSRGSGQGSGEALRRRLQGETAFTISEGVIKNIPLLEELAKQTKSSSFKELRFNEFTGHASIANGSAHLQDWNERGKDQMVSMDGSVTLDGQYKLIFQPAVTPALARKAIKSAYAQELLGDQQGYIQFPFQLAVAGTGHSYRVEPKIDLSRPVDAGVQNSVRSLIGGVIQKEMLDREKKKHKDKKRENEAGILPRALDQSSSGTTSREIGDQSVQAQDVGGMINGLLQKQLDRHHKKDKHKKKHKGQGAPATLAADQQTSRSN